MAEATLTCAGCGADLKYDPGISSLKCQYCGEENVIEKVDAVIEEQNFLDAVEQTREEALHDGMEGQTTELVSTIKCPGCAAAVTLDPNITADNCPYCDTALVEKPVEEEVIRAQAVLPFRVTREEARGQFRKWIDGLWFAPGKLKEYGRSLDKLQGIYLPHWTYDSDTMTRYRGQRGEHYWDTEWYTDSDGKRKTRRVRKTRWYSASGTVYDTFDDVLVVGSHSLPTKHTEKLEPWDLAALEPFQNEYLAGFRAERYTVSLEDGFGRAQQLMEPTINSTIRRDIGGDEQRISSKNVTYSKVTFKHILLPVWVSAYRWKEKVYRFLINARTGEVQGERPWSFWKITFAVLGGIAVIGGIVLAIAASQGIRLG